MRRRTFIIAAGGALLAYGRYQEAAAASSAPPAARPAPAPSPSRHAAPRPSRATIAVSYAAARVGHPYVYGAAGPDAYDCSGLVMMAYRAAGVSLPRTSEEQWASGHQVTSPQAGDLVFFPGSDGTWAAPGHVAIITGPGRIIQAYDPQVGVVATSYGQASSLEGTGRGDVIGYTRPSWQ